MAKYTLTIATDDIKEIEAILYPPKIVGSDEIEIEIPEEEEPKEEKPNEKAKPKAKRSPVKKTKEAPKKEAEPKEEPAETKSGLTYEADVRPAGLKLIEKCGRDALIALFDEFGVENGKELTPDQFQPFIDEIEEKIKKAGK